MQEGRDVAILCNIGRKAVQFALTGEDGRFRPSSLRSYAAADVTSVAGALSRFQREVELPRLPERMAASIAGLTRGEAVSVTRTRLIVSRPGLQAMLGRPPLLLNDFAAEAWAIHSEQPIPREMFGEPSALSTRRPGCYCVVGITSGLGVAVIHQSEGGVTTVLPTEAGHGNFAPATREAVQLVDEIFQQRYPVAVEDVISAPGLVLVYKALARREGVSPRHDTPEQITRAMATDPVARLACEFLCRAFWSHAGSLVVSYGAWDGLIVIGKLAEALRPILRRHDMTAVFVGQGRYQRLLAAMPRALMALECGELVGAAEALRHDC